MEPFEKLEVWQLSHELTLKTYKMLNQFPVEEKYNLVSQMRRSICSVPTNIVEGHSSLSTKGFIRFLGIARASASEYYYQLILSRDLNYIDLKEFDFLATEIKRIIKMINSLIDSLHKKSF